MNERIVLADAAITQAPYICDFCGEPDALPSYQDGDQVQAYCPTCASELGKELQAYEQLSLLVEEATTRWLMVWGHESFSDHVSSFLAEIGDKVQENARNRVGQSA